MIWVNPQEVMYAIWTDEYDNDDEDDDEVFSSKQYFGILRRWIWW